MKSLSIEKSITNRSAVLDRYLNDISKISLLEPGEEVILSEKIRDGDRAALDRLVNANLRFVVSVAKKYQNTGMGLEDLINEGNIGLIKAAERFDATRGFRFISFAVWWIRQSIMYALACHLRVVRVPGDKLNRIGKVNRAGLALEQSLERFPSVEELAEYAELNVDQVLDCMAYAGFSVSLDQEVGEEPGLTLLDTIIDQEAVATDGLAERDSDHSEIQRILGLLTPEEREVIVLYYGLEGNGEMMMQDICLKMRLSGAKVRQLRAGALYEMMRRGRHLDGRRGFCWA